MVLIKLRSIPGLEAITKILNLALVFPSLSDLQTKIDGRDF